MNLFYSLGSNGRVFGSHTRDGLLLVVVYCWFDLIHFNGLEPAADHILPDYL